MPQTICLLALEGMITTSLSLPLEMLTAALHMQRANRIHDQDSELLVTGENSQPVRCTGGLRLQPDATLSTTPQTDVIFIPSFWRNPSVRSQQWQTLKEWLIIQHQGGAKICATGTGVFLLADTGLLDGQPATTHWYYLDRLHKLHPELLLKRHHLLTQSGNLYCAGSVNSIADLTIHLIEQMFSSATASRVAQQFSPEIRRRYSELFYSFENSSPHQDESIVMVQQWLHEHYPTLLSFADVAKQFSMSQRTLNRRFLEATGLTPSQWLLRLRVEKARDLLTSTNLDICDIALRCGFQDPGYFSRVFRKHMETTPGQYRSSVRSKLFSP
ncbi:GlxA family transcriptional regulator [Parendozoicomonas haliclonae]|uniref:HTH-type transcriptional regulator CdhR n=1 Tax=Parendozoicomonas haliclonae TaxID=1960125 RepID=A0A1X7AJT9_9GAMM|nr:helix-turn-helix domain-containing protein [Parendozoicomonas haliclonae]SMA47208.1 HTH-type transcriptional regulator CdhR [Parendozoicomonas haliclonae]